MPITTESMARNIRAYEIASEWAGRKGFPLLKKSGAQTVATAVVIAQSPKTKACRLSNDEIKELVDELAKS